MKLMAIEYHDYKRIEKLEKLNNIETFWDDVGELTKRVTGDHAIRRWEILAEKRYKILERETATNTIQIPENDLTKIITNFEKILNKIDENIDKKTSWDFYYTIEALRDFYPDEQIPF